MDVRYTPPLSSPALSGSYTDTGSTSDISVKDFHHLLLSTKEDVKSEPRILVIDCRPFLAYNVLHISSACNSMIPPIIKRRSRGIVSLHTLLPCENKRRVLQAGHYAHIIVYDEETDSLDTASANSNLCTVLRSLRLHVENSTLRYLQGGFRKFLQLHPDLCATISNLTDVDINVSFSRTPDVKSTGVPIYLDVSKPAEILPYLFLGDSRHAGDKDVLKTLGITAIVNVSKRCVNHFPDDFTYKTIPVEDKTDSELDPWFSDTIAFIDSERAKGGKVLVHCQAGVSRSATICMAYVMFQTKCPMDEAFERVKRQRHIISPNLSFMRQLQNFERNLQIAKSSPSPHRPLPSPCRASSAANFWGALNSASQAADDSYRWALSAGSIVSPLLSPTASLFSSPLLSPI